MQNRWFVGAALIVISICGAPHAADGQDLSIYAAGTATIDITPDYPIRLNGFGGRRDESEGVSQRIFARALAVSQGDGKPFVILAVDSLGVRMPMVDEVARRLKERFGVPREQLVLTFTHSHCTPKVNGASDNIFSQAIPPAHQTHIDHYTTELTNKLAQVAFQAIENREPAHLEYANGTVGFAVNRRTKGGPVDHDLPMLVVRSIEGNEVRAVYVSYACHCVTLSFNQISGDWAGYAAEAIERTFSGATALVSIGCGSDSNPSSGVTGDRVNVARSQGVEIANEVTRLLKTELRAVSGSPHAQLSQIALPLNDPPSSDALSEMATAGGAIGYNATTQLARLDRGESLLTAIDYPIQSLSFGNSLTLVFLAGEVCADYALRLKEELDHQRIWIQAYSNDFCCYVPSERLVREGGYGGGAETPYFALPSTLKPGLEQRIIDEVKRQVPAPFHVKAGTQGVAPKSPEDSLKSLRTHDDLRIELVAAEPLIVDPVAIDFGADGRLWVAEMADYGRGVYESFEPSGRIRWLRDNDGDGRFEEAHTFVDGLRFPTDVKVEPDGVIICDAPDILFAADKDQDGKADSVTKLYSGFEVRNAQARVNSIRWGLDNWLYGSGGLFGGTVTNQSTAETVDLTSRDFRFDRGTGAIEAVTGRTQQGRCRDDWGDWFGCTNSTLIMHYPVDDNYHRRNPLIATPATQVGVATGEGANTLIPIGELVQFELSGTPGRPTSACGLDIYRDNLLGDEYYGNAFTCEPVHQLVHRLVLGQDGLTFSGRRADSETNSEFLASTDRWFRPVQVRTGPDGAIWIVDMYRYVIEHSRWIPQATLSELNVFAGQRRGRIYRVVARDESRKPRSWPRLDKMEPETLVAQLDQPNGTLRDLAHQLLVARGDGQATSSLKQQLRSAETAQGRLHALCTLDGLRQLDVEDLVVALESDHPEILRHGIRLSERRLDDADLLDHVIRLARHANPRVGRQAAYSLGESRDPRAAETLAQLASFDAKDPYLKTAILSSVNALNAASVLAAYSSLPEGDQDRAMFSQLVSLAVRLGEPEDVNKIFQLVVARTARFPDAAERFDAVAELLEAGDARSDLAPALDTELTAQIRTWHAEAMKSLSESAQGEVLKHETVDAALRWLGRPEGPTTRALLGQDIDRQPQILEQLGELISATQPIEIQQAAVACLARIPTTAVAGQLLERWDVVGPTLRTEIIETLLAREESTRMLLDWMGKRQVTMNHLNATQRQRLLTHTNEALRQTAEQLLDGVAASDRAAVIERYRAALASVPDPERGRTLFRKACATCHRLEDHGHSVGPDLVALTNRDPHWLLAALLDPNREVDARYMAWTVVDRDGRSTSGLLAEETSTSIRLVAADGKERVLLRNEIDAFQSTGISMMPEGLERDLSPQDVADVIAYVTRFDVPPKEQAGNQPRILTANGENEFRLTAESAEIRGGDIAFERMFGNVGYWHGEHDRVSWRIDVEREGTFDIYLDFACAPDSAGNQYRVDGLGEILRGIVPATGGWDRYEQHRVGTAQLASGRQVVTVSSDGPLERRALFDLREVRLVPSGKSSPFAVPAVSDSPLPRYPPEIAPFLLDETQPRERREDVIDRRPGMGPAILSGLIAGMGQTNDEEYRRIPWIWRVAIAVGKRNDGGEIRDLLDVSLPQGNEPLRDWQAVVLGGGVINGISQRGLWPRVRMEEILAGVPNGESRWQIALDAAAIMVDDTRVPAGTRYDALRMIALDDFDKCGKVLKHYLATEDANQLQMGAVSGLVDIQAAEIAEILIQHLPRLSERNQKLAWDGLLRDESRSLALLTAIEAGRVPAPLIAPPDLLEHASVGVRTRAKKVFAQ